MAFDFSKAKEQYGSIYKIYMGEPPENIYFRSITKHEYRVFLELNSDQDTINFKAEQFLLSHVVLEPSLDRLDQILYANDAKTLIIKILEESGFVNFDDFTSEVRNQRMAMQTLGEQVIALISKALPIYKIEELEQKNAKQLAHLLAISEVIMGQTLDIPGADIQEPAPLKRGPVIPANPDLNALTPAEKNLVETTRQRTQAMLSKIKQR
jgi:hypothetical protein